MKPTILTIGDTVVDAFIELADARVTCAVNDTDCTISMKFGDKIPFVDDEILYGVGNSANAAVSTARLGLNTRIITHVGHDDNGAKCIETLAAEGIDARGITAQDGIKTNYHYVLRYGPERTILVRHQNFTYDWNREIAAFDTIPDWVYLSSLAGGTEQYHDDIAAWLVLHPSVKLVFQPGSFQMKLGLQRLAALVSRCELFVCNVEEAERMLGAANDAGSERAAWVATLSAQLRNLGPRIIAITDGPRGAYVLDDSGMFFVPPYPDPKPPVERTGAGDAYASTFTAFLMLGMDTRTAALRAPINSMSVVQYVGAQRGLLGTADIERYIANAPAEYRATEISQ